MLTFAEKTEHETSLLKNIVANLPTLDAMLAAVNDKWVYDDRIYRFYHQSFKVFDLQSHTMAVVALLQSLAPDLPLNAWFMEILKSGTGKEFKIWPTAKVVPHYWRLTK